MDGIEELKGVVVLAATNRPDLIDKALLRSGRFDLLFELPPPDENTRADIFRIHTKNKPLNDDIDIDKLAAQTENMVGSDLEFICRKASMFAIREFIENEKRNKDELKICRGHFEKAIELVRNKF